MTKQQKQREKPTEGMVREGSCLNYVTFWLDDYDVKRIQALADLEETGNFYTYLRYHVAKTGLECLFSNHEEIGQKFAKQIGEKRGDQ